MKAGAPKQLTESSLQRKGGHSCYSHLKLVLFGPNRISAKFAARIATYRLPPHGSLQVAFGVSFLEIFPFVVQFSPSAEPEQYFGDATFVEVDLEWNERQPLLVGFVGETMQLAAVQQQFARALGLMVPN